MQNNVIPSPLECPSGTVVWTDNQISWFSAFCASFFSQLSFKSSAVINRVVGLLFCMTSCNIEGFLGVSDVNNLPAKQDAWVQSPGGKIPWRKEWYPTPAFLPGESHGQRNLVGYIIWGHKESDTTEVTQHDVFPSEGVWVQTVHLESWSNR